MLAQLGNGSEASLRLEQVQSLAELEQQQGPYDAIVVAAGAAAGVLPEVGMIATPHAGRLAVCSADRDLFKLLLCAVAFVMGILQLGLDFLHC